MISDEVVQDDLSPLLHLVFVAGADTEDIAPTAVLRDLLHLDRQDVLQEEKQFRRLRGQLLKKFDNARGRVAVCADPALGRVFQLA